MNLQRVTKVGTKKVADIFFDWRIEYRKEERILWQSKQRNPCMNIQRVAKVATKNCGLFLNVELGIEKKNEFFADFFFECRKGYRKEERILCV